MDSNSLNRRSQVDESDSRPRLGAGSASEIDMEAIDQPHIRPRPTVSARMENMGGPLVPSRHRPRNFR